MERGCRIIWLHYCVSLLTREENFFFVYSNAASYMDMMVVKFSVPTKYAQVSGHNGQPECVCSIRIKKAISIVIQYSYYYMVCVCSVHSTLLYMLHASYVYEGVGLVAERWEVRIPALYMEG